MAQNGKMKHGVDLAVRKLSGSYVKSREQSPQANDVSALQWRREQADHKVGWYVFRRSWVRFYKLRYRQLCWYEVGVWKGSEESVARP